MSVLRIMMGVLIIMATFACLCGCEEDEEVKYKIVNEVHDSSGVTINQQAASTGNSNADDNGSGDRNTE